MVVHHRHRHRLQRLAPAERQLALHRKVVARVAGRRQALADLPVPDPERPAAVAGRRVPRPVLHRHALLPALRCRVQRHLEVQRRPVRLVHLRVVHVEARTAGTPAGVDPNLQRVGGIQRLPLWVPVGEGVHPVGVRLQVPALQPAVVLAVRRRLRQRRRGAVLVRRADPDRVRRVRIQVLLAQVPEERVAGLRLPRLERPHRPRRLSCCRVPLDQLHVHHVAPRRRHVHAPRRRELDLDAVDLEPVAVAPGRERLRVAVARRVDGGPLDVLDLRVGHVRGDGQRRGMRGLAQVAQHRHALPQHRARGAPGNHLDARRPAFAGGAEGAQLDRVHHVVGQARERVAVAVRPVDAAVRDVRPFRVLGRGAAPAAVAVLVLGDRVGAAVDRMRPGQGGAAVPAGRGEVARRRRRNRVAGDELHRDRLALRPEQRPVGVPPNVLNPIPRNWE